MYTKLTVHSQGPLQFDAYEMIFTVCTEKTGNPRAKQILPSRCWCEDEKVLSRPNEVCEKGRRCLSSRAPLSSVGTIDLACLAPRLVPDSLAGRHTERGLAIKPLETPSHLAVSERRADQGGIQAAMPIHNILRHCVHLLCLCALARQRRRDAALHSAPLPLDAPHAAPPRLCSRPG